MKDRSPSDLEHDIRRTRADISETLNEIEARISPAHLKEQVKGTLHETLDEVQDRLDPRHLIHNARRTMIDTIRENPVPSILAGLSLGYLIFNGASDDHNEGRRRTNRTYDDRYRMGYDPYAPLYGSPYAGYGGRRDQRYGNDETEDESRLHAARERSGEMMHQASDRASEYADQTREHLEDWAHDASRQMHRAKGGLETFVHEHPLAAGAIAIGIGALIGGLLPETPQENQFMGRVSDRVTDRIEDAASSTLDQAKTSASHVMAEAKDAARDEMGELKSSAQDVSERVKDAARDEAQQVKNTAKEESRGVKDTAVSEAHAQRTEHASS